jgi:glycosyltransferase involved in cell wall biosynthesis
VERSELGVPPSAFAVCCVANWRPRKGIEVLVEAFRRLPAEAPIHLILVGDMRDRNLRRSIETHPRRDRIRLLGIRTDAPSVAAACDVAVLPALKREGLAKTVIEAMAYGIPPIVTDVGGNPELVENGVSGIVVPPSDPTALADAILRLDRDRRLAHELGERARLRIAERFSIRTTIERTAGLYRELVRRP